MQRVLLRLQDAGVRFLVVGGLAVLAHGHARFTEDIDLVLDLSEENLRKALSVFRELGYASRVPVAMESFADSEQRNRWRVEKHMIAFTLIHPGKDMPAVDLFTALPFDLEEELARALRIDIEGKEELAVISLGTLLQMKKEASRPKDQLDVLQLMKIHPEAEIQ